MAKKVKQKLSLSAAIDGFWTVREMDFSPRTVVTYNYYFKAFVNFIGGDTLFENITSEDVRRFLNYLINEKSLSKRSSCDHWVALSSLWTWAEKELSVTHVIRDHIERPKFTKKVIEPFTEDEVKAILKKTTHKRVKMSNRTVYHAERDTALRDKAIIMVLLDTGIRASELCDLKNSDYDSKKGKLFIQHGKGDKERVLYLGANAKRALWRYLTSKEQNKPHKSLFNVTRSPNGKPMSRADLFRLLQRLGKNAGVKRCNVHRFRHTFAINFLRNGGSALMLQHLLGHESLDITKIYVKLAEIDAEKSAEFSTVDRWDL